MNCKDILSISDCLHCASYKTVQKQK